MMATPMEIEKSVKEILQTIPSHVTLLAAAKTRSMEEVEAVIGAGVTHIGYNYVQEALPFIESIGQRATWHMIGHLQRNKAKVSVQNFDMIETVDSWKLAQALEKICAQENKTIPVLIEINSGREENKTGVCPEKVEELVTQITTLKFVQVNGLMTMGPRFGDPEDSRPFYHKTRQIFEQLKQLNNPNITMQTLSMGMSNSYQVAIEEGANLIRIGTKLFGER
jgi:pyridoxal phosphate enzyme (YggS family)